MAPKQKQRPPPIDDPPTASSSDSEEEHQQHDAEEEAGELASSSEEEASSEEEDDDEEEPPTPLQPTSRPTPTISHPKPSSSDSESDSSPDHHPAPPAKVKPLASKPMEQAQKPKVQPKPGSKRAVENNNAHITDPKRAKTKVTDSSVSAGASDEEDPKKSSKKLFQRLWSEEDELAILKGIVEYTSNTGQDPLKYPNAFHDFMKKSLHVDASSNQLKEKIRRLKKKFNNNAGKGKNGENPKFSKPHDQKAFELSKKVWGSEQVAGGGAIEKARSDVKASKSPKKEAANRNVASGKKSKPETKPGSELASVDLEESGRMDLGQKPDSDACLILSEMSRLQNGVGVSGLSEDQLKRGLELIGESKRVELDGKLKKLRNAEMELIVNCVRMKNVLDARQ
ncbi:hypothetical protein VNO77_20268 [Canavalia gladiata]|uniref:Glabrous enhancer-binding protein-like DBD domain-containing protein n=1 Tax=Canavalia gladiata TaxID=3824 RepID=A0AAN9QJ75_CANGL